MRASSASVAVSVVVPTFKRPDLLERCLKALLAQNLEASAYEIIVCDDAAESGAGEPTRELVEALAPGSRVSVRYAPVRGRHGPAAARNTGYRQARGEIVAFTDDDTIPDSNWLAAGKRYFDDKDIIAVWGKLIMPIHQLPTDYEADAAGLAAAEFVTANCFCRRSVLDEIDGFDERFTAAWREDSDLHFRLIRWSHERTQGAAWITHGPDAVVVHPVRPARWGVSLSQQRKSMFNALLYKKHPELYRRKIQSAPPVRYYMTIGTFLASAFLLLRGQSEPAALFAAIWAALTLRFAWKRLRDRSKRLDHVFEMILTSALIPPLSVYWRIRGAWKFRVLFL